MLRGEREATGEVLAIRLHARLDALSDRFRQGGRDVEGLRRDLTRTVRRDEGLETLGHFVGDFVSGENFVFRTILAGEEVPTRPANPTRLHDGVFQDEALFRENVGDHLRETKGIERRAVRPDLRDDANSVHAIGRGNLDSAIRRANVFLIRAHFLLSVWRG